MTHSSGQAKNCPHIAAQGTAITGALQTVTVICTGKTSIPDGEMRRDYCCLPEQFCAQL